MTLRDLSKVYHGDVRLIINAYFESGEYYSFRSYRDYERLSIYNIDDYTANLEIEDVMIGDDWLMIELKEILKRSERE